MAETERAVVWSPEAEQDLIDIGDYSVETWSLDTAEKHLRAIGDACERLGTWPFSGRARGELNPGLRSVAAWPHVVFYRVTETNVQIVRVVDGRRDLNVLFADPE